MHFLRFGTVEALSTLSQAPPLKSLLKLTPLVVMVRVMRQKSAHWPSLKERRLATENTVRRGPISGERRETQTTRVVTTKLRLFNVHRVTKDKMLVLNISPHFQVWRI